MIVGIDLGTSNSLVSIIKDNETIIIPNYLGKLFTPSVISVKDDAILIGEPAVERLVTHPALTVAHFKRAMGSQTIFKLGDLSFRPEELGSLILKRLKEDAESYLGEPVTEAVISVPAYFSDAQRKATKIAGKLAGLKVERLINEPTAAGLAYGLHAEEDETTYLIFDLGGGTFDVSIISLFSGIIEVRASNGDNFLGGMDFTKILKNLFIEHIQSQEKNIKLSAEIENRLIEQAERAKFKLANDNEATMEVSINQKLFTFTCDQDLFEKSIEPLMQKLRDPIRKAILDAKMSVEQIDQVILVGGSSRLSVVKRMVSRMFNKLPRCHLNPDTVVAQGAAIQAGLKALNTNLDEIVITDVAPYSLGIEVFSKHSQGTGLVHFEPLISRNTVIPVSRVQLYKPTDTQQPFVNIRIFQGENFYVEKNVFLGEFKVQIPKNLINQTISVRFTYDINGLLEVEAILVETGEKTSLIIESNPGVMSEIQIQERLKELSHLKIHPREQSENLLLLSRAERLYQDLPPDLRIVLAENIKNFIAILDAQDQVQILKTQKSFYTQLNKFELEMI